MSKFCVKHVYTFFFFSPQEYEITVVGFIRFKRVSSDMVLPLLIIF